MVYEFFRRIYEFFRRIFRRIFSTNFFDEFLTIASFRIGVPSILFTTYFTVFKLVILKLVHCILTFFGGLFLLSFLISQPRLETKKIKQYIEVLYPRILELNILQLALMILSPRISYKQSSLYQQVHLHRRQRPMRRVAAAAATAAATAPQGSIKKPSSIQKSIWCTGSEISPLQLGEIFSSSLRKLACYAVRRTSPKC